MIHTGHVTNTKAHHSVNVTKIIKHPWTYTDVALLKIFGSFKSFPEVRSICLPEANIVNMETEYAMIVGWGQIDRNKPNATLQMGYRLLLPSNYTVYSFPKSNFNTTNFARAVNNRTGITCEVGRT